MEKLVVLVVVALVLWIVYKIFKFSIKTIIAIGSVLLILALFGRI